MKTFDSRIRTVTGVPKVSGISCARASGFTMIEMLMTIAIGAIVMALAIPSFRYVTNANRIAGEINGLLGDLQFARSEAIKEGQSVTVCVSTDNKTCSVGNLDWESGWIVFSAATPGAPLRVQNQFSGSDTFVSNTVGTVTFNREGYAGGLPAGTLITLHATPNVSSWTRCLSMSFTGQITTEMLNGSANGSICQ